MAVTSKLGLFLPQGTDLADVKTSLCDQLQKLDEEMPVEFCTWATPPPPEECWVGKLIWLEDVNELRFWDGSGFEYILSRSDGWGREGYFASEAKGNDVGPNQEIGPYAWLTYTQYQGRLYRVGYSVNCDTENAEDFGNNQVRIRRRFGTTVTVSDTLIYWMFADSMNLGTKTSVPHCSSFTYTAGTDAIITIGMFLYRGNEGTAKLHFTEDHHNCLFVEDVGWQ